MGSIPFGIVKWLELIWQSKLPPNAKYIAAYLRTFMNDKSDMAWPSYTRMEHETGLSRSTLSKYLTVLEEENWLTRERGSAKINTRYYANLPQKVSDEIVKNALQGSSRGELGSSRGELGVVREANSNKQYNKQNNNQEPILGEIVDLYERLIRQKCNAKGVFKESFLNNQSRVKNLKARLKENPEHKKIEFWENYFLRCSQVSWIREGINGEPVCTLDMLVTKNKFDKNVEAFWA